MGFRAVPVQVPAKGVEHFEIPANEPRVLSFDEEKRLMPVAEQAEPYLLPFVTLALGLGLREIAEVKDEEDLA